jgi:transposase
MHRHALTDAQWHRLQRVLPRQRAGPASTRGDRLFIEAVPYRAKTGSPWRDLPERFGPWKSVYNRFSNWARRGHWAAIFRELQFEIDDTGSIVDGSVIRAHQDASGGKGGLAAAAMRRECDGMSLMNQRARARGREIPGHLSRTVVQ